MKSNILKNYLMNLIYFECEDMNYFENPYSSDIEKSIDRWSTMDSSISDKPMTIVLDLEAIELGRYTGGVRGVYLFDININVLKTYEGTYNREERAEYFKFEAINYNIIEEVESPIDERSFGYTKGFKERILALIV